MKKSLVAVLSVAAFATAGYAQEKDAALPVRAVTLFSSGVSYTVREGDVDGNAQVPLTFRTAQINDILKSLILIDEKGKVQPAVYGAKDPIGRTLQSFAVDITQSLSRADLLNRLRGAQVTVTTQKETLSGRIVGVEKTQEGDEDKPKTVEVLSILGVDGLQSARLQDIKTVKILDEKLNREFNEALAIAASGADERRRTVTLKFDGSGRRKVRVGYISESPLWKISYRLLIGDDTKPYLQGWAIVENTSDEDWNGVKLSLVSGRPVSFIQDLYQPLYLPRPIVPVDVVASPYPQLAEGSVTDKNKAEVAQVETEADGMAAAKAAAPASTQNAVARRAYDARLRNGATRGASGGLSGAGGFGGGGLGGGVNGLADSSNAPAGAFLSMEQMRGDQAQAQGEKSGELFSYNINTPVTLPRQQAALIPVVAQAIGGEKVSVYNSFVNARFPLNGVRVVNNTPLHLKGGAITVFDGETYAGDARMEEVPPGDNRLVTYAVDLSVEAERQKLGGPVTETGLSLRRGVLIITRRERQEAKYVLTNKGDKPRRVLIEHPFDSAYKLIAPEKFTERTAKVYRFSVTLPPNKPEELRVVLERPYSETIAVVNADLNSLSFYANRKETSDKIQAALREIIQRRRTVQELQNKAAVAENEVNGINTDQERIRKNMGALDKTSDLYKRYVKQLDTQESRIQTLRATAARLRNEAAVANQQLQAYLDGLDILG